MEFFMLLYNHSKEQNTHDNKQHVGKFYESGKLR